MARWANRIQRALIAGRAPRPVLTRSTTIQPAPRIATIGLESSLHAWLPGACDLSAGTSALVIDPRPSSRPATPLIEIIVDSAQDSPLIAEQHSSWSRLTGLPGAALQSVDVPSWLLKADHVVVLTAPTRSAGVARLWIDVVHPNSAMRALALPHYGFVELAAWLPATWVVRLAVDSIAWVAVTRSVVMAELLAVGLNRLSEQSAGIEALTPWEEPGVQRLFELQLDGADCGTTIRAIDDTVAQDSLLVALAEAISATIVVAEEGGLN
ncbi:MAG TPA: hypothetical protein PK593_05180 [Thermomicrobiales bacterium]|mgnify:CR=1 FL=1|nr:hypothetical protein [Chloroflexota bacterium]HBY45628.1 hypothetical protein [Chloroflexota bacterium]HQX62836.1 hypothetical protein [Thermomicrobiales bacterium]HRA30414.1 hypothetical protein [Thermomicrobiales bacterium]